MPVKKHFKSLDELISKAAGTRAFMVPLGSSHSLPIPRKTPPHIRVISFLYRAPIKIHMPKHGKVMIAIYPPHKILIQDAHTGKVIRFADCKPEDFGIDHPLDRPLLESAFDFNKEGEDLFLQQKERFMKISPKVWEIYSRGRKIFAPSAKESIEEYKRLFKEIIPKPLIPFYLAVSSDFFEWLDRVSA